MHDWQLVFSESLVLLIRLSTSQMLFARLTCLAGLVVLSSALTTPLPTYNLTYQLTAEEIELTLDVDTDGWIGFGLSRFGGMKGALVKNLAWFQDLGRVLKFTQQYSHCRSNPFIW